VHCLFFLQPCLNQSAINEQKLSENQRLFSTGLMSSEDDESTDEEEYQSAADKSSSSGDEGAVIQRKREKVNRRSDEKGVEVGFDRCVLSSLCPFCFTFFASFARF
jgi:hypothetical protein